MPDAPVTISNVLRNFLSSDYMISANPFLTSVFLENTNYRDYTKEQL